MSYLKISRVIKPHDGLLWTAVEHTFVSEHVQHSLQQLQDSWRVVVTCGRHNCLLELEVTACLRSRSRTRLADRQIAVVVDQSADETTVYKSVRLCLRSRRRMRSADEDKQMWYTKTNSCCSGGRISWRDSSLLKCPLVWAFTRPNALSWYR